MQPANNNDSIKHLISQTTDPWKDGTERSKEWQKENRMGVSQIIGEIYIARVEKFVEAIRQPCRSKTGKPLDATNPHRFELIMTFSPNWRMVQELPDLKGVNFETLRSELEKQNIEWHQLGISLPDDKNSWWDIVFNATFIDSELMNFDYEIDKKKEQKPQYLALRAAKKKAVVDLSVDKWFEPTFKLLNNALVTGKKTLVHCIGGRNRSPTYFAAFLIWKGISAEQALWHIRSRRFCAKTKCMDDLKAYEVALAASRNAQQASTINQQGPAKGQET